MSENVQSRALAILMDAIEKPEAQWLAFAQAACCADEALLCEVQSLLASHAGTGAFSGSFTADVAAPKVAAPARTFGPDAVTAAPPRGSTSPDPRTTSAGATGPPAAANVPPTSESDFSVHGRFVPGTRIAGRYRMVSLAGRGGMCEVYRADDLKLGHPVALKFLPRDVTEGSRRFQMFLTEVRLSRQIAHPNVCRVYDIDGVDGQHFLSMEYIDGEDLRGLLRRIGRLPFNKGLEIAQQLCAGLAAAHEKGVLHRDLKPANIMIDGRGQARITDFGLARLADGASGAGEIAGTLAYMAPEQLARGQTTVQSDLYSLGLVLYEVFTGQPFHKGGPVSQAARGHEPSSPRPPCHPTDPAADLDPAVERAILQCLRVDPGQRHLSARAVAEALVAREASSARPLPHESQPQNQPSLAVLPFVNMSSDHENEFLSDGITEDLIAALSRVKGLRVPARTSSFAFKGKNQDIRHIGQLLNVETVLEGSVRKSGNKLRATAQLVKVRDGFHLWSERYDREMKDVFEIQDDITRSIVAALEVQLGSQADSTLVRPQTASTEAYEFCAKGRVHWSQRGIGLEKAVCYFDLALLEDPNYALAWSGLADAYALLGFYDRLPRREALAKAKTAAEKAVALDDNSAEAHCSLAVVLGVYQWDVRGAERHFRKALELNSNYTPARYWYSEVLLALGRDEESIAQNQQAVEGDPLSVFAHGHRGWMLIYMRRVAEALPPLHRSLSINPDFALGHWQLGQANWLLGQRQTALLELHRAVELSGRLPMILSTLGSPTRGGSRSSRKSPRRCRPAPTRRRQLILEKLPAAVFA